VAFTLLIGTVQLVARLQRSSTVGAVASEAAHRLAQTGEPPETTVHRLLGPDAEVHWQRRAGWVRVEVAVASPIVPGLSSTVHRGATVRVEAAP
jgi:hypothetical protein